jgi:hypothetical protein
MKFQFDTILYSCIKLYRIRQTACFFMSTLSHFRVWHTGYKNGILVLHTLRMEDRDLLHSQACGKCRLIKLLYHKGGCVLTVLMLLLLALQHLLVFCLYL